MHDCTQNPRKEFYEVVIHTINFNPNKPYGEKSTESKSSMSKVFDCFFLFFLQNEITFNIIDWLGQQNR